MFLFCVVQGTAVGQTTDDYAINTSSAITNVEPSEEYTESGSTKLSFLKIAKKVMITGVVLTVLGVRYYVKKQKGSQYSKYDNQVNSNNNDNNNQYGSIDINNDSTKPESIVGPINESAIIDESKKQIKKSHNEPQSIIVPALYNSINDLSPNLDNQEAKNEPIKEILSGQNNNNVIIKEVSNDDTDMENKDSKMPIVDEPSSNEDSNNNNESGKIEESANTKNDLIGVIAIEDITDNNNNDVDMVGNNNQGNSNNNDNSNQYGSIDISNDSPETEINSSPTNESTIINESKKQIKNIVKSEFLSNKGTISNDSDKSENGKKIADTILNYANDDSDDTVYMLALKGLLWVMGLENEEAMPLDFLNEFDNSIDQFLAADKSDIEKLCDKHNIKPEFKNQLIEIYEKKKK